MQDFELPDARYGMTATDYNITCMPSDKGVFKRKAALEAANAFNHYRFRKLTLAQRAFVDSFLSHNYDAKQAALTARLAVTEAEAVDVAIAMLKKTYIREAIRLAEVYFTEKCKYEFDAERHLQAIEDVADANMADFLGKDFNGEYEFDLPMDDRRKMATIQSLKITKTKTGGGKNAQEKTTIEVKLHDTNSARKELFRLRGHAPDSELETAAAGARDVTPGNGIIFNIVGVPSGQYIPAPLSPYQQIEQPIDASEEV